jgi:branched-chain amino acid transport system permease protein
MTLPRQLAPLAVFVVALLVLLPLQFQEGLWLTVFTQAVAYSIASLGVGLLYGRLGLVSLANFAFYGVGGWVALRLALLGSIPVPLCVLAGGVVAAVVAVVIGLPALRVRGLYLALVTLMAAGAFYVVISAVGFPDGGGGFSGREGTYNRRPMPRPSFAEGDVAYFRFAVVVAAVMFVLAILHLRGKPGRAWAMIRRSQAAALASGVDVTRYKTWAFAFAGFLSGVAGGLAAGFSGQLNTLDFRASASMLLFGLAISAGAFHLIGAVIASLLANALPRLFTEWGISGDLATLIFGVLLMVSLTTAPEGAAGAVHALWAKATGPLARKRAPVGPPTMTSPAAGDVEPIESVTP